MANRRVPVVVGSTHAELTILEYPVPGMTIKRGPVARVLCSCGAEKFLRACDVVSGRQKSCGCGAGRKRHGMAGSPEYHAWGDAKQRCHNPSHACYQWYGARGIYMDECWANDFQVFLDAVGKMPKPGLTLERLDVNAGYVPGNCIWATSAEQARNTRRNVYVQRGTKRYVLTDLARAANLNISRVHNRKNRGWPESRWFEPFTVEEAIAAFENRSGAQPT